MRLGIKGKQVLGVTALVYGSGYDGMIYAVGFLVGARGRASPHRRASPLRCDPPGARPRYDAALGAPVGRPRWAGLIQTGVTAMSQPPNNRQTEPSGSTASPY